MARTSAPVDPSFERMKRMYITQFKRTDPHPQQVPSTQITDRLYLGSVGAAYNEQVLKTLKITHILTVCDCLEPKFPTVLSSQEFEYKVVIVADEPRARLSAHFR